MISSMRCSTFLTNPGLRLNPKRVFFENASVLSNPYMPAIMKRFLFLSFLLAYTFSSFAQELNVTVKINVQKLQTADPRIFETLEQAIAEFMNNTKWTEDVFDVSERINCNLLITLQKETSPTSFSADLAIQASRPVYGSSYETALFNHIDRDVSFTYEQFQPLQYSKNAFNDNLSAVLSFYAFTILGLDYDSFGLYGGEPYFLAAQDIVNTVPQSGEYSGWRPAEGQGNRNRFWIAENMLSPRIRLLRQAMYTYHRQALDIMHQDAAKGRSLMSEALENVLKVNQTYPNSVAIQMFINAKSQELMEIFKLGTGPEKEQVIRVMSRIDAANTAKYRALN